MTTTLRIIQGESKDFPLQAWNEGGMTTPAFGPDDLMTAVVSPGEGRPALFAPAVEWWTAPVSGVPTQTGYEQGQVLVRVAGEDSATLEAEARYALEVWRQAAGSPSRSCAWRGSIVAGWAAGAPRPRLPVYCTYEDMLDFGPWCRYVQDEAAVQAGFYDQRLEARLWLDDLITRADRGTGLVPFGSVGVSADRWSGWGGPYRSPMPGVWIRDQLWGGSVQAPVTVTARGAGYTSEPLVIAPPPPTLFAPGRDLSFVTARQRAATFRALLDGAGGVGGVAVVDPGFGYAPGSTITLGFTSEGGGAGAAAEAAISPGRLLRRDVVRRIAAFKALAIVGLQQVGQNGQHVAFGEYFAARASEELSSYTAELDLSGDGLADVAIPLYHTNTIYI